MTAVNELLNDGLPRLRARNQTLYELLIQVSIANRAALNDRLNARHVVRLQPFLDDILHSLQAEDSPYTQYPPFLGQQLELLLFAIQQRVEGSHNTIRRSGTSFMTYQGGWQRVLETYDHISQRILARAGVSWRGFVVIGFAPEFRRFHGGIINLPREAIAPNRAWGLFHELGHEWGALKDITLNEHVEGALQGVSRARLDEFVWEVAAEAFAWQYGFGLDRWDLCLKLTWRYLRGFPNAEDNAVAYLSRWIVLLIMRRQLADAPVHDRADLLVESARLAQHISVVASPWSFSEAVLADAMALAWETRGLVPVLIHLLDDGKSQREDSAARALTETFDSPATMSAAVGFFLTTWHSVNDSGSQSD